MRSLMFSLTPKPATIINDFNVQQFLPVNMECKIKSRVYTAGGTCQRLLVSNNYIEFLGCLYQGLQRRMAAIESCVSLHALSWDRDSHSVQAAGRSTAAAAAAVTRHDAAVLVLGSREFDERAGANNNVIAFATAGSKEQWNLLLYAAHK